MLVSLVSRSRRYDQVFPSSVETAAVSGVRFPPWSSPWRNASFQISRRSPVDGIRRSVAGASGALNAPRMRLAPGLAPVGRLAHRDMPGLGPEVHQQSTALPFQHLGLHRSPLRVLHRAPPPAQVFPRSSDR